MGQTQSINWGGGQGKVSVQARETKKQEHRLLKNWEGIFSRSHLLVVEEDQQPKAKDDGQCGARDHADEHAVHHRLRGGGNHLL